MISITIDHVTKRFGATTAVDSVNLLIPAGDLFFLLGPSGCGKTTLLRMIAGFVMPDDGRVLFGTQDMTYIPPYQRDAGMVFQSYALWPHMTVAANVGFGLDVRKIKNPDRAARIAESLELVQMAHLADRKPNQLSGGQQQRVALARALAIRPKCLLLDEPLSNLDAKLRMEMRSEIRRIVKQSGITALYVTHDQKEALSMADGIAVLRAGKLEQTGKPLDLYRRPASKFVADFIGESNFLTGTVESTTPQKTIVQTPVGPLESSIAGPAFRTSQNVIVAFRPESVIVSNAGVPPAVGPSNAGVPPTGNAVVSPAVVGQTNQLPGKLLRTTYLGEMAEHLVQLANGQTIKAFEMNPNDAAAPAENCVVTIPPENVMVVAE
jgi:iron(III) transport system ATP-binding protein